MPDPGLFILIVLILATGLCLELTCSTAFRLGRALGARVHRSSNPIPGDD